MELLLRNVCDNIRLLRLYLGWSYLWPIAILVFTAPILAISQDRAPDDTYHTPRDIENQITSIIADIESARIGSVDKLVDVILNSPESALRVSSEIKELASDISGFRDRFGEELFKQIVDIVKFQFSTNAINLRKLTEAYLPPTDEGRKKIEELFSMIEKLEFFIQRGNLDQLPIFEQTIKSDLELDIVQSRINLAYIDYAEKALTQQSPVMSLRILAKVHKDWRNEDVFKLASTVLGQISELVRNDTIELYDWPFDEKSVKELISATTAYTKVDIAESLADIYSHRVIKLVEQGSIIEAEEYFDLVLHYRPDRNERNNELRFKSALVADSPDSKVFARKKIEELKQLDALTFGSKVKLLFAGFYGKGIIIIFYITIAAVLITIALAFIIPFLTREKSSESEWFDTDNKTILDEYSELLEVFGLSEGATEAEIKRAYRDIAKSYHPDGRHDNGESPEEASRKFIELKKQYDRILEIKKSCFWG
jgi:hypothetical protein